MIDLSRDIANALDGFTDDVEKALQRTTESLARKALKEVKANAPVRDGTYKKSLKTKKINGVWVVYSQGPHYRLTHLLEKGHAKQTGGRTKATPHWKPAEDLVLEQISDTFKRELK